MAQSTKVFRMLFCLAWLLSTQCVVANQVPESSHWVAAWGTALVGVTNNPDAKVILAGYKSFEIRERVHLTLGGNRIRITVSNEFGEVPLKISALSVARCSDCALSAVTFSDRRETTIPPGAVNVSDPLNLTVAVFSDILILLQLPPQPMPQLTVHAAAHATTSITLSDAVYGGGTRTVETTSWYFLKSVKVEAKRSSGSIVVLGDSITDGSHSTTDQNRRWPDDLARRLQQNRRTKNLSVINAGIGGNRVLNDRNGPAAIARLDRDVFSMSGIERLIILEGINDIAHSNVHAVPYEPISAEDLIGTFRQIVALAHEHGLKVTFGTILPFAGNAYFSETTESLRQNVNEWLRTNTEAESVIDFDQCVQDPAQKKRLLPSYDSGDHLHPNDAGYQAMADCISVTKLR